LGYTNAGDHMLRFLWKGGDLVYKPWNQNFDSAWVFKRNATRQTLQRVRKDMWRLVHEEANSGNIIGHVETLKFVVPYDTNDKELYYAFGEFFAWVEADYSILGCYSVLIKPIYHFSDTYDWHVGLAAGGGVGGLGSFKDEWTNALADAGKAQNYKISGYWSGPNKLYNFLSNWIGLPADQNNYLSEEYDHWYDVIYDIFK
jgi:hypothetical protein